MHATNFLNAKRDSGFRYRMRTITPNLQLAYAARPVEPFVKRCSLLQLSLASLEKDAQRRQIAVGAAI